MRKYAARVPNNERTSALSAVAASYPGDATWLVVEALRRAGARSRSDVAERTGLGRAVVAQRVGELGLAGLVMEDGTGKSTGGRPPRHLHFNSEAGHILAADLGATSVDVAVSDLDGRILTHRSEPADVADGPEAVLERVELLMAEAANSIDAPGERFGVGIGVPGPVEFESGRPVAPPIMPGWDDYPIRERLEDRFGAPVWVDNDVNVMALGEWRAGVARNHRNVIFVKIGSGIGAGLIFNGQLYRGSNGSAGDLGHAQVGEAPVICRCGNTGCLEALAGGQALAREALEAGRDGRSQLLAAALDEGREPTGRDVAEAASRGDRAAVDLLVQSGHYVGAMLATVVNLFNPSLIVIGGGVALAGDVYLAAIRETVYRRSLPLATRRLQIVPSGLGLMAGVIGAASMVADELFSPEHLATTLARHLPIDSDSAARSPAAPWTSVAASQAIGG